MSNNLDTQLIWESYRDNSLTFESIEDYDLILKEHNPQLINELAPLAALGWVGTQAAIWGPRIFAAARAAMTAGRPAVTKMLGSQAGKKAVGQVATNLNKPGVAAKAIKEIAAKKPDVVKRALNAATKVGQKVKPTVSKVVDSGKAGVATAGGIAGELTKKGVTAAGKGAGHMIKKAPGVAGKAIKGVGKGAGKAVKGVGGAMVRNPGKVAKTGLYGAAGYGAYDLYNTGKEAIGDLKDKGGDAIDSVVDILMTPFEAVGDAVTWLSETVGDFLDANSGILETVAEFMVSTGIPALVILILLYGGYKLLSWIFEDDDDEQPDQSRA